MSPFSKQLTSLQQYTKVAGDSSARVIRGYSTSFGWATKLLGKKERGHVRNIYALVRVADEIVDGAAAEALRTAIGVDPHLILDRLEQDTYAAIDTGFSSNMVVHAFATSARYAKIERAIIRPFFASMRMDLTQRLHDKRSFDTYVYGSAEVVGLMCLRVFLREEKLTDEQRREFEIGAKALGAAFQKVNFLRDLSADYDKLGRSYFPLIRVDEFNNSERDRLVADIQADLDRAKQSLVLLPSGSKRAVAAAQLFFEALSKKIAKTAATDLLRKRIRVNNAHKVLILLRAALGSI